MNIFRSTHLGPIQFAFAAAAAFLVPSYLLLLLLLALGVLPKPVPTNIKFSPVLSTIGVLFIAPVIETYVMIPILSIFNKVTSKANLAILLSAIFFGLIHYAFNLNNPVVFPIITWGFFVFGKTMVHWRQRRPDSYLWIVMLAHALANLCTLTIQSL